MHKQEGIVGVSATQRWPSHPKHFCSSVTSTQLQTHTCNTQVQTARLQHKPHTHPTKQHNKTDPQCTKSNNQYTHHQLIHTTYTTPSSRSSTRSASSSTSRSPT